VSTASERINDAHMVSSPPDETTSPEALVVLARDGVHAYQRFLAARRDRTTD
jgi:hypothetical protein